MIIYVDTSAALKLVLQERESAQLAEYLVTAASLGDTLVARSDLMFAAAVGGGLGSADAIHLATAIRLQVDLIVAYDNELNAAAVQSGLNALSPGA